MHCTKGTVLSCTGVPRNMTVDLWYKLQLLHLFVNLILTAQKNTDYNLKLWMSQINVKIKDDILLLSCFVGHPVPENNKKIFT